MRSAQPHTAVWLDIPRSTDVRASFTVDGDIHVMFGSPSDEMNVVFERPVLVRVVEIVSELLAVPESVSNGPMATQRECERPGTGHRAPAIDPEEDTV